LSLASLPTRINICTHNPYTQIQATCQSAEAVLQAWPPSYQGCTHYSSCPSAQPHCCSGRCVCDDSCSVQGSAACVDWGECDDTGDIPQTCAGASRHISVVLYEILDHSSNCTETYDGNLRRDVTTFRIHLPSSEFRAIKIKAGHRAHGPAWMWLAGSFASAQTCMQVFGM